MPRPPKNLTVVAQDFADFLNNWPDEYYFDDNNQEFYDSVFTCDAHGYIPINPMQILNLEDLAGYIDWQGKGDKPADMPETIQDYFLQWREKTQFVRVVLKVPKDQIAAIKTVLEGLPVTVESGL